MSDSNGSKDNGPWIVGGSVLLISGLLLWIALAISEIGYRVSNEQATSAAYKDAEQEFENKCTVKTSLEEVVGCFRDSIQSAREPGRSEEDVDAQKQMAIAAWAMLKITLLIGVLSIALTFISIFYIRQTLAETARTAYAATEANKNTLSAIAQEQANAQRQLRAYINVTKADTAFQENWKPIIQIVMKNGGQTPANQIIARIEATVKQLPLSEPLVFRQTVMVKHFGPVGPGDNFHLRLTGEIQIDAELRAAISKKLVAIFVIGDVHYTDVFKNDWHTEFVVVFDDFTIQDPTHQLPAWSEGNKST